MKSKSLKRGIALASLGALTSSMVAGAAQPPIFPETTAKRLTRSFSAMNSRFAGLSRAQLESMFTIRDAKGNTKSLIRRADEKIWALGDPESDKVEGTRTLKAYNELGLKEPATPVIVAVIDGGVEITHPALKDRILVNEAEKNGQPGVDDDKNGYVDDVHGWNFIGSKDGKHLTKSSLEVAREYGRLSKKEMDGTLTPAEKELLAEVKPEFESGLKEAQGYLALFSNYQNTYLTALEVLRTQAGLKEETLKAVEAIESEDEVVLQAKAVALNFLSNGISSAELKGAVEEFKARVEIQFNPAFDPSSVIGDNPAKLDEQGYGNADVVSPTADHGTHVSGIIGAVKNAAGMEGQARWVRILPVRAVPDGDERDKDVANAVRYAVDRGAKVINMSFGKSYSPNKDYVDAAFEYAESKGVLVVHSAGNSAKDTSNKKNYPNAYVKNGDRGFANWLEIAASGMAQGPSLPAEFTNYSKTTVDLFAPGVDILSTVPGGEYASFSGTSMAGPEVAGAAALILSQRPDLTPAQLRELLMKTVRKHDGLMVLKPGTQTLVPFADLTASGGILDVFSAFKALGY